MPENTAKVPFLAVRGDFPAIPPPLSRALPAPLPRAYPPVQKAGPFPIKIRQKKTVIYLTLGRHEKDRTDSRITSADIRLHADAEEIRTYALRNMFSR